MPDTKILNGSEIIKKLQMEGYSNVCLKRASGRQQMETTCHKELPVYGTPRCRHTWEPCLHQRGFSLSHISDSRNGGIYTE